MTGNILVGSLRVQSGVFRNAAGEVNYTICLSDLSPEARAVLEAALALRNGCSGEGCIDDWGQCDLHIALEIAASRFAASIRGAE